MPNSTNELLTFWAKIIIASGSIALVGFSQHHNIPTWEYNIHHISESTLHTSPIILPEDTQGNRDNIGYRVVFSSGRDTIQQKQILEQTESIIKEIDNLLPTDQKIRNSLHTITINNQSGKSRWYSSHSSIIINYGTMATQEFREVLTHELAHIIDLGIKTGINSEYDTKFTEFWEKVFKTDDPSLSYYTLSRDSEQKKHIWSKKEDFCSIYAMSNPFEDWAECVQLYINHYDYFSHIQQDNVVLHKKFNIIAWYMKEPMIWWSLSIKTYNLWERYWDTTRIQ